MAEWLLQGVLCWGWQRGGGELLIVLLPRSYPPQSLCSHRDLQELHASHFSEFGLITKATLK